MAYLDNAKKAIAIEMNAISALKSSLDDNFNQACECLQNTAGKIIVIGMGKSGHVGHKIAATLASTGSPAFFVHPAEASHGDLGMIGSKDVVLAISNSGNTDEIMAIIPVIKRQGVPLVTITGNAQSPLAIAADISLVIPLSEEACPLGLAPTSSTTSTLVLGDAIAVSLLIARGFTEEDFARAHPGGSLGKRLYVRVKDLMVVEKKVPKVRPQDTLEAVILEMTEKALGMTTICDSSEQLLGIFTDGDLRRTFNENIDIHGTQIGRIMTPSILSVHPDDLAIKALGIMQDNKITSLVAIDDNNLVKGVLHLHHLLDAGLI